jgi:hypothetical protein
MGSPYESINSHVLLTRVRWKLPILEQIAIVVSWTLLLGFHAAAETQLTALMPARGLPWGFLKF